MEIYGVGELKALNPFTRDWPRSALDAGQTVHAGALRDHVEISPLGQMLDGISQLPEIRYEKVEEIRRQSPPGRTKPPKSSSWPLTACSTSSLAGRSPVTGIARSTAIENMIRPAWGLLEGFPDVGRFAFVEKTS